MSFKQFSTLLVQDGVVPIHKVEEAFQRQILFGGRLGTNLLEIGALDEVTLLRYLNKASGLPFAGRRLLQTREPEARQALSPETVRAERAIPIAIRGDVLCVLVTDPLEPAKLESLSRQVHRSLEQFITSELRFDTLLHEFYGDPLEKRTVKLIERFPLSLAPDEAVETEDDGWGELEAQALSDWDLSQPAAVSRAPSPAAAIPEAVLSPSPEVAPATFINPRRSLKAKLPATSLSYDELTQALRGNLSRDELYRLFARFCMSLGSRCAVFTVLDERLRCQVLEGPSSSDARGVIVSVRQDSDLREVCRGHSYYQGPSADTELASFYERIGAPPPPEVIAVPIKTGERVLAVALVDNLLLPLGGDLNLLFKSVYRLGEALERLSRERQELGFREVFGGPSRPRSQRNNPEEDKLSQAPRSRPQDVALEMVAELDFEPIEAAEPMPLEGELLEAEMLGTDDVLELDPLDAVEAEAQLIPDAEILALEEETRVAQRSFLEPKPRTLADVDIIALDEETRVAQRSFLEPKPKTLADVDIIALDDGAAHRQRLARASLGLSADPDQDVLSSEQLDFIEGELEILPHEELDEIDEIDEIDPFALEAEALPPEPGSPRAGVPRISGDTSSLSKLEDDIAHPEDDLDFWVVKLDSHHPEVAAKAHRLLSRSSNDNRDALLKRFPGRVRLDRFHFDKEMPSAIQHSRLLGSLVLHGADAAPALLGLLDGPSVEERFYALLVLGELRVDGLVRRIWRRIYDKDAQIRRLCAQVLRTRVRDASWPEVLELLLDGAGQADDRHVELSLNALSIIRDFSALGTIIALLEHANKRIADAALQAAIGCSLNDLGVAPRRWEKWLEENRSTPRTTLIGEALIHKERHIRVLAAEELSEIPGIMLNYHPDGHRREQAKARDVFLEWAANHEPGFRSSMGSGLGRTWRGQGRE